MLMEFENWLEELEDSISLPRSEQDEAEKQTD